VCKNIKTTSRSGKHLSFNFERTSNSGKRDVTFGNPKTLIPPPTLLALEELRLYGRRKLGRSFNNDGSSKDILKTTSTV
jgi:hypothetical protein